MKNLFKQFNKAFTLAEVLITLVIIGVVAALAISPLINTYVESSTVSKVKKGLSMLGQAKKLAEVQNGSVEGWNFGEGNTAETAAQFWQYIKPHLSISKDCGTGTDCYQDTGVYQLNGAFHKNYSTDDKFYKFILSDGSVMWLRTASSGRCSITEGGIDNVCACFFYDVNGDKKPNTFGRDVFLYVLNPDGVYPNMTDNCNKHSAGWGCTAYIIKNSNMKYLH